MAVPSSPSLLAVGDPLVALTPTRPVALDEAEELALRTGGAEVNTAIGVSRLGLAAGWLGRVGNDPLGRRVVRTLREEGVDTSLVVVDPVAPTGLYLREWLPDGLRRPYYYRRDCAGSRLDRGDWPTPWPAGSPVPTVLHVTGITLALSDTTPVVVGSMVARAAELGCVISVDPNYRALLWPDRAVARERLRELLRFADVVLLSEEDADLLFDTTDPTSVRQALRHFDAHTVVLKRGAAGAIAWRGEETVDIGGAPVAKEVDPVGAGDAFNAGFLAATMRGLDLRDATRCGAWCGARAVEQVGESSGSPTLAQLPTDLREALESRLGVGSPRP
jgi:2-dehydro-3-deoxygluconokinase